MRITRAGVAVSLLALAAANAFAGSLTDKIAAKYTVKSTDVWYGGERTVFDFKGYDAWVVEPPKGVEALPGRPWTWTMQWRTAFVPRTSVPRLLKAGWCHVSVDIFQHRMDATGLKVAKEFQDFLVGELGFAPKAMLIGMSWGGFFSTRYAANYPDCVAKIYLDAPLLSFTKFSKQKQDEKTIGPWAASAPADGNWEGNPEMPVNLAGKIAASKIPVLLLYGGVDPVVPPKQNSLLFADRFKKAGGDIKVVARNSYAHHPHGVEESENTIVDFFTRP